MGERKTAYHYGQIIREYREQRGMTQAKLSELWPCSNGEEGVNVRYVQDIEYGNKKITDPAKLRKLSDILHIPLWKLGLSEYDPFNPSALPGAGQRMYSETLDVVEVLIHQTFAMRRVAPLPEVEKSAYALQKLFSHFLDFLAPPAQLELRFLRLYAQEQNIAGLMCFENKQYDKALKTFEDMYALAKQSGDSVLQVHALEKMGLELNRAKRKDEAVEALEKARDLSFQCGKHVMAFANAYLAHVYAAAGESLRFERAINTAQGLATSLGETYGDGTDFIFQRLSNILQLKSSGFLRTGQPEKTLALHDELKRQIGHDTNLWIDFRLHLYRARAYLMLDEIEDCITAAREFLSSVKDWKSPHRIGKGIELLKEIDEAGYGKVKVVDDFRKELEAAVRQPAP